MSSTAPGGAVLDVDRAVLGVVRVPVVHARRRNVKDHSCVDGFDRAAEGGGRLGHGGNDQRHDCDREQRPFPTHAPFLHLSACIVKGGHHLRDGCPPPRLCVRSFLGGRRLPRWPQGPQAAAAQRAPLLPGHRPCAGRRLHADPHGSPPGGDFAFFAALSGLAGAIGLASFYRGLAIGNMGVVAPISSTAAIIPVVVGIASGDRPAGAPVRGARAGARRRRAGVARGGLRRDRTRCGFACCARSASGSSSSAWTTPAMPTSAGRCSATASPASPCCSPRSWCCARLEARRADAPVLATVGTLDITANGLFAIASTEGLVSLVSRARLALSAHDRGAGRRRAGRAPAPRRAGRRCLALAGVVLIAAG